MECEFCSTNFDAKAAVNRRFCSRACYDQFREFLRSPSPIIKHAIRMAASERVVAKDNRDRQERLHRKINEQKIEIERLKEELRLIRMEAERVEPQQLPQQLAAIPNITFSRFTPPGQLRGVYILCQNKKPMYVGQSVNVLARLGNHESNFAVFGGWDEAFVVHTEMLDSVERTLIRILAPPWNKATPAPPAGATRENLYLLVSGSRAAVRKYNDSVESP